MTQPRKVRIGVVGFSRSQFDPGEARQRLKEGVEELLRRAKVSAAEASLVSGLTNMGVPKLAYELAVSLGLRTVGVSAKQALRVSAGVFPVDFLNSLEAAELAGATTESLLRMAKEYEDRARTAMRVLTAIATVGVMLLVFGVLILAIFTLFFQLYMKPINEALEMTQPGRF